MNHVVVVKGAHDVEDAVNGGDVAQECIAQAGSLGSTLKREGEVGST